MSAPLRDYVDPVVIRGRLAVLYAKAARVVEYDRSCASGRPDIGLLDAKQRAIMAARGRAAGQKFPGKVFRTLGRTIDFLESRAAELERHAA